MRAEVDTIINGIIELATNSLEKYHMKLETVFTLEHKVLALLEEFGLEFLIHQKADDPEVCLVINFGDYSQDIFHITYEYHVTFSKLVKAWKDAYYSRINHPNPENASGEIIYATDCSALTKTQYEFRNRLMEILDQSGFLSLDERDLIEVIPGLASPLALRKDFGPQPTVDMLIFKHGQLDAILY